MKKAALPLLVLGLALGGCVNLGERNEARPIVHFVLDDVPTAAAAPTGTPTSAVTLLVPDTVASGFYDSDQLVFSRSAGTRGQYQFARWTERPGKRFAELLRARLTGSGWQVSASSGYVRGERLLDTALVEFYHDAAHAPGQVRLVVRAELVDLQRRSLLARRVFVQEVPVARYDAAGAAEASGVAVGAVLDAMTAWLATQK